MIKKLWKAFLDLFKPYKVPDSHETCPQCKGGGSVDGLLNCDYCDGYGHVSNWESLKYEQDQGNS